MTDQKHGYGKATKLRSILGRRFDSEGKKDTPPLLVQDYMSAICKFCNTPQKNCSCEDALAKALAIVIKNNKKEQCTHIPTSIDECKCRCYLLFIINEVIKLLDNKQFTRGADPIVTRNLIMYTSVFNKVFNNDTLFKKFDSILITGYFYNLFNNLLKKKNFIKSISLGDLINYYILARNKLICGYCIEDDFKRIVITADTIIENYNKGKEFKYPELIFEDNGDVYEVISLEDAKKLHNELKEKGISLPVKILPSNTTASSPDTTARSPDTTASLPNTTASLPDTTESLQEISISIPDTTASLPNTTTASLPDTTASLPNTTTESLQEISISLPNTTTESLQEISISIPDTTTESLQKISISIPDTTTASLPDTYENLPEIPEMLCYYYDGEVVHPPEINTWCG